jgi:predicted aldo/keto reductase-like oxidoreductase
MYYNEFNGDRLSALGFGTMRLPLLPGGSAADIDKELLRGMFRTAIEGGVNYFDSAWVYHDSLSETVTGELLSEYPRESFFLATKYPGHQISSSYDPHATFEEQLRKCRVEYFDYYLFHNVNNLSIETYLDPKWGMVDAMIEEKKRGRIRHLGFSCHGDLQCLERFIEAGKGEMEFCQIQLNYLDWSLQDAKAKYELITEKGLGVWVMEPVRGGRLANLPEEDAAKLKELHPEESCASWGFRWLQGLANVKMILSGMSLPDQVEDNLRTFAVRRPLAEGEAEILYSIAEKMKSSVPCTACRYCCEGCPAQLDIPGLIRVYNDLQLAKGPTMSIAIDTIRKKSRPEDCIGCGQCEKICPQGIPVPELMKTMQEAFDAMPTWEEICLAREEKMKNAR